MVKMVKIASGISFTRIYPSKVVKSGENGKKRMRKMS